MNDVIRGKAYVLGDHIDTDQIIPAQHLVYSLTDPEERKLYGKYALSSVPPEQAGLPEGNCPFVPEGALTSEYTVIIGGGNFGCGSSREQPSVGLVSAGVATVVARSFARIFYRSAINQGLLLIECPAAVDAWREGDAVSFDAAAGAITVGDATFDFPSLPPEILAIRDAGGLLPYVRAQRERVG